MTSEMTSDDELDDVLLTSSLYVISTIAAAIEVATPLFNKIPYHTSALDGPGWVAELLEGHPERIRHELGVHKHVFRALIEALRSGGIRSSRHVAIEEKLAVFLYTCVTGMSIGHVGERFQRSSDTLSK